MCSPYQLSTGNTGVLVFQNLSVNTDPHQWQQEVSFLIECGEWYPLVFVQGIASQIRWMYYGIFQLTILRSPLNHLELTCFVAFFGIFDTFWLPYCITVFKKDTRKVQGVPQSQAAAHPRHEAEEKTDKTKQAQIEQMYEKH